MVLIAHASAIVLGSDGTFVPRKSLAVVFFFALSGFVMSSAYEQRIRAGIGFPDFIARRIIRLYPMIAISAVAGTLFFAITDPRFWIGRKLTGIAVLGGFLGVPVPETTFSFGHFPINPPVWSLFNELIAYVMFIFL